MNVPSVYQIKQVLPDLMQCVCVLFVEKRRLLLELWQQLFPYSHPLQELVPPGANHEHTVLTRAS